MTAKTDPDPDATPAGPHTAALIWDFVQTEPLAVIATLVCMWALPLVIVIGDVELISFTVDILLVMVPAGLYVTYRLYRYLTALEPATQSTPD